MKLSIKFGVLVGLLCVCLQGMPTFADDQSVLTQAEAAYKQKDYVTGLKLIQPLAEKGNPEAQFHFGWMYDQGKGVQQSDQEALKWYQKAADQGFLQAKQALEILKKQGVNKR